MLDVYYVVQEKLEVEKTKSKREMSNRSLMTMFNHPEKKNWRETSSWKLMTILNPFFLRSWKTFFGGEVTNKGIYFEDKGWENSDQSQLVPQYFDQ